MLRGVMSSSFWKTRVQSVSLSLRRNVRALLYAVLSGGLLVLAFPQTDLWFLAWAGLVPLLFALDGRRPRAAFLLGYLSGVVFFGGTLYWLIYVTVSGGWGILGVLAVTLMVAYLSVYFGLFSAGYAMLVGRSLIWKLFLVPGLWVVLEFIRDRFLTGFGWVMMGHSQYKLIPLIQIADVTGVFGVSFLVVMGNYLLREAIGWAVRKEEADKWPDLAYAGVIAALLLAVTLGYGVSSLQRRVSSATVKVAVLQPNIPQELKWEPAAWPLVMQKLKKLTELAALERPDIIIWPETSFPGYIWESPEVFQDLRVFIRSQQVPVLVGAVTRTGKDYRNTSMLISAAGDVLKAYHKKHLVPFGEFLPLRKALPFLDDLVPIGDFTPGREHTRFLVPGEFGEARYTFSVLICFEDTVARVTRPFVREGAALLINVTNDAWFMDSKEPFMHLQSSVFRAVENRRSLVRSANTGVSCFIDKFGRVTAYVRNASGKRTFVHGWAVQDVPLEEEETFYTKFGDVFTYLVFGVILFTFAQLIAAPSRQAPSRY